MWGKGSAARRLCLAIASLSMSLGGQPGALGASQADQTKPGEPSDPKARKTFAEAVDWRKRGFIAIAVESYRKANKQDNGNCAECLTRAFQLAQQIGDFKAAENVARDWLQQAKNDSDRATAHFNLALALQRQGIAEKKEKCLSESCDEFNTALQLDPAFVGVHLALGVSKAYLHRDDEARAEFKAFIDEDKSSSTGRVPAEQSLDRAELARAERYLDRIELARARMAPPFEITSLDGRHISMDNLAGKVVLIDFWATWCGPCREALPRIRKIAQMYEGQPFVVLSVSLDSDEAKWRDFVARNEMTWLQYRDGGFKGPLATLFAIDAIPATFSIDADGVLEDQHVGDADIEGKLKKMIAHAREAQNKLAAPAGGQSSINTTNR